MAQNRVVQVLRVYARVASLVVVFLAMTGLLYFLLPAPIDPSTAATSVGSPRERSDVHNPPPSPATSPPSSASSSASSITPISSPTSSEACSLDQVMQPRASPLPSRGPPRLEHYRASIIVPVLSLNANIAANLARLLAFLNTTYHLSSPLPLSSSSPATTSWSSARTLSPSSSSSSTTTASKAAPTTQAVARASTATAQRLVEVLLVVDPMRLPIQSAAERATANATPYPSFGMAQQWDVYHLKRMLRDFQYELRVRDETFLRVITLSPNMSGDAASASSCHQSGGDVFGAACNLGAVRARGQWLFFLSAETYFEQGWFEEQLQALDGLQSAKGRASGRTSPDSAGTGLIGCKILDGPTAARAHSAGFDVALSRRELLPAQAVPVASASAPRALPPTTTVKKRGRGSKLLAGSKTIDEWRELLTKKGSEELRKIMETMDTSRPDERDEDLEPEPEVAVSPPQTTQPSEPADGYKFKDVVFPYRRLEGVARADGRFNKPAEIIAPSSMCFIVDKRTFLNEAKGFRVVQTASTQRSADGPRTPFLQVLDLSLRLRSDNNRRSLYLPTQMGVIRNKPEGAWNAEDDTTREDHGLCSSTLFPVAPAASPSPVSALPWWMSSSAASGDSASSLSPQPLSVAERDFAQQWRSELMRTVDARRQVDVELVWDSYGGCTGWGLEAVRFVTALEPLLSKVAIIASDQGSFCPGLPRNVMQSMRRARSRLDDASVPPARWNNDSVQVWMSHKPPVSYPTFPYKGTVTVTKRPDYVIGRSMTETTAMPAGWADNAKRVDEIWVPSSFLVEVFASGGVPREKLVVVPIPIDTQFYSPLPFLPSSSSSSSTASLSSQLRPLSLPNRGGFNFLSVFKWEQRKGWDVLLDAYLAEFKPEDNTTLYIQTYLPGSMGRDKSSFEWKVMERATALANNKATPAAQSFAKPGASSLPRVEILCTEVPEQDMPRLYAAVDAFVLPTRGEGFGMPIMEAMSMGLPTIATNWSGQVDFMNERNAYPLRVEAMVSAEAPSLPSSSSWTLDQTATKFAGEWAQPSVQHLRQLMRHVFTNRKEAKRKGESARADIVAQFSQDKVAELVVERLKGVERVVRDRRRAL